MVHEICCISLQHCIAVLINCEEISSTGDLTIAEPLAVSLGEPSGIDFSTVS